MRRKALPWVLAGFTGLVALGVLAAGFRVGNPEQRPVPRGTVQHFTYTEPARPVPDTRFVDQAGKGLDLSAFRGRTVLLNFWATWCAPCVREMPALDRLQGALGGRDFIVLIISEDRGGAEVAVPFLKKLGIERLSTYFSPNQGLLRAFGVIGLPTTILIDASGREVGRLQGAAEWDAPEARGLIRYFIAASPTVPAGITR